MKTLLILFVAQTIACLGQMPPQITPKIKYDYRIVSSLLPTNAHFEIWYQEQAPVGFTEYNNHVVRSNLTNGTVMLPDVPIWVICIAFDTNGIQYKSFVTTFEPAPQIYLTKAKTTSVISKPFQLPLSSVVFLSLEHSVNLSNWSVVKDYIFTNPLTTLTNAIVPAEFFRVNIRSNIIQ